MSQGHFLRFFFVKLIKRLYFCGLIDRTILIYNMKQRLLSLFLLLAACIGSLCATAQTRAYLGYCEGHIATATAGHLTGITGDGATIDLAIRLPKSMLAPYVGCQISGVNFGLPTADLLPEFATAWVRTSQSGANTIEGTNAALRTGWNLIGTTKSYVITGQEEELWVGVSFRQLMKQNILSFAGTESPDGAWVAKNGKWTDYSSKNWGSLAIEAVVEGRVPTRNLSFVNVQPRQTLVEMGRPIVVCGTIKNNATQTAEHPIVRYDVNNGLITGEYAIPANVAFREAVDFTLEIPTTDITDEITADVDLTLCWPDGEEDDGPEDNVASVTADLVRELFYRTMVVEEGTGAWCGWCVYGIVGLREMKKLYGDRFIGIAVHNGDQYVVGAYDSWMGSKITGYPSCLVNRKGGEETPMFANLESFYQHMDPIAEAGIDLTARYDGSNIICEAVARFFSSHTNSDYRIVFVVTENQLPILQKNYYAGNARGPMGGFENMEGDVNINVDDIARGIYPSTTGKQGSIPAKVEKGVGYGYRITTAMPKYRDADNVEVVAMLLNGKTGEVIQAAKTAKIYGFNAEEETDGVSSPLTSRLSAPAYDLAGRRIAAPAVGQFYIQGGAKRIMK